MLFNMASGNINDFIILKKMKVSEIAKIMILKTISDFSQWRISKLDK